MMKVLFLDRQLDLETYLADVSIGTRPEEDWSIQLKHQQDEFQDQVVYQENLHHFNNFFVVFSHDTTTF